MSRGEIQPAWQGPFKVYGARFCEHWLLQDVALLKLTRALKSLRAVRILRSFRFVRGLRVLVKACRCFLPSLFWSMVLLAVFMAMGALTLGNTLQVFILDEMMEQVDREWLWEHYGTSQRSAWTLYEVTFAGPHTRQILEHASNATGGKGVRGKAQVLGRKPCAI